MTGTDVDAELEHVAAEEARWLMGTFRRQPLLIVRGHGAWVVDSRGRELLDLVAGIAVNVLGHSPAPVRAALEAQSSELIHASNLYYTREQVEAARLLVETAFPSRVFWCNSGTEAVEGAIKLARKWGRTRRGGAWRIVCMEGGFHGRTMGALSATGKYLTNFEPPLEGFTHVPADDADAVADALDDEHCAVLVEPILGEHGVEPLSDGTLRALRRLCDERDALLVLDEVQTGMGRTGRWWAHQHVGITPDVMTAAKGLGGGIPIGAILAAPRADVLTPGDHGSTFGGNPLATSVAAAVIRAVAEQRLVENAEHTGARLRDGLLALRDAGLPVAAVRGRGLMLALVLDADLAPETARAGLEVGVVVNPIGARVLRLVPPLTLTPAEADEGVRRIGEALALAAGRAAETAAGVAR
ncbi:MAG TPA: acetylornithine/succinylornithine family transaminase [Candidatus Dormibacteraeota bacterium]|nr:acetylornithine/succinylornithine family transaminase [Candidatus Dormibacteraeota bacterium]